METLGFYLVKSAALMAVFLGAYHLLLKRETFFKSNRWYLLLGLVTSLLLPLVTFKKVILVEAPQVVQPLSPAGLVPVSEIALPEVDNTFAPVAQAAEPSFQIDWLLVLAIVYGLVALALTVQFARDFFALRKLLKGKTVEKRSGYKFVDVPENVAPFSYFSYIVYNSKMFSHDELINILEHEKVHSIQKHTLDVLLSRMVCIAFWWNPVVWFYKKAIIQNLEFIADSEAAKKIPDLKAYQITLLKITTHENCVSITNHFFQSLIKKRIVMLNKNQSSKWNSYKYLFIVPALAAFMLYFQVKVVAQHKNPDFVFVNGAQHGVEIVVDKNTSDAQLKQHAEDMKKNHGIKLRFSKVKRNAAGEITCIKAEFKDENGKKGTTMVAGDKPIEPIRFYKNNDAVGFGDSRHDNFRFVKNMRVNRNGNDDDNHNFTYSFSNSDDEDADVVVMADGFDADDSVSRGDSKVIVKSIKNGKQRVIVNGKVVSEIDVHPDVDVDVDVDEPIEIHALKSGPRGAMVTINGEKVFDQEDIAKWTDEGMREAQKALAGVDWDEVRDEAKRGVEMARVKQKEHFARGKRMQDDKQRAELEQMKADLAKTQAEMERTKAEIAKMRADLKKEQKAAAAKKK